MRGGPNHCPGNMNKTQPHPVELAIVAALVPVVALVLVSCARKPPLAHETPVTPQPIKCPSNARQVEPPHHHPITLLATELQALPVTQLRAMTGTRSKSIRKAQLIAMVAACS